MQQGQRTGRLEDAGRSRVPGVQGKGHVFPRRLLLLLGTCAIQALGSGAPLLPSEKRGGLVRLLLVPRVRVRVSAFSVVLPIFSRPPPSGLHF